MGKAFPYSRLDSIYNKNVKESLGSETSGMLNPLLAAFYADFEAELAGEIAEIYITGQAEMISYGQTKLGIPIAYEGPPQKAAIDWAQKHAATMVTKMNEETKRRLAGLVSSGIDNKKGIPGLAKDIRGSFDNMSKYRSELIARTETANALSQASLDSMEDMGIEGKEWVTAGDDRVSDECQGNEAQGVIPVNQAFSGGVMAPPQHPDCRCVIAPARLKK